MQCSKLAMLGTIGQQKVYERGIFSVKMVYKKARLDLDEQPPIKTSLSTPVPRGKNSCSALSNPGMLWFVVFGH